MDHKLQFQNYTILVVDDDPYIMDLIQMYLKNKNFHVLFAHDGQEALTLLEKETVHLVILDIMLPKLNGWEVCKKIRETSDLPILMLTAKGESENKMHGFGLGADDYIVKPFDPNELVARVTSLLRRTYTFPRQIQMPATLHFDSLRIDTIGHTVTINQEVTVLTPKEFKLLLTFAEHPNQVLDRQQLLDRVWGDDYFGEDRVVDVTVRRLRQKLSDDHKMWKIETIWGMGYKFKVKV